MVMASLVPHYTAAEVRRFQDDRVRYEVIRGELFVSPAPGAAHQVTVVELARRIGDYLDAHGLGIVVAGPYEIEFSRDTAVQPDLLVVLRDRGTRLPAKRLTGPPSLVVEVVSRSSRRTDRLQKRELYLEEGVPEYWVVDTEHRHVERWLAGAAEVAVLADRLTWRPVLRVPPLTIDLRAFFRRVWSRVEGGSRGA